MMAMCACVDPQCRISGYRVQRQQEYPNPATHYNRGYPTTDPIGNFNYEARIQKLEETIKQLRGELNAWQDILELNLKTIYEIIRTKND